MQEQLHRTKNEKWLFELKEVRHKWAMIGKEICSGVIEQEKIQGNHSGQIIGLAILFGIVPVILPLLRKVRTKMYFDVVRFTAEP